MSMAKEELRNIRQKEKESIRVYAYRWGHALVRSSGIRLEDEKHPYMIKDFISSLQKIIRNKITNRWPEMRGQPKTVQEAFDLAIKIETQIQITESFKIDLNNDFPLVDINEISKEESSSNELEINEMSKGKRWGNNSNYRKTSYINCNNSFKPRYNPKQQDTKPARKWEQIERDSKITLTQESSHFIPSIFSNTFFKQFDLVMKLKKEELKKHSNANTEVGEITEENLTEALGDTKDHVVKVVEILGQGENTENSASSSA